MTPKDFNKLAAALVAEPAAPAFRLEIFNGKVYQPVAAGDRTQPSRAVASFARPPADALREQAATLGARRWRVVLTDKARPARPSYRKAGFGAPSRAGYSRSVAQVQREYLEWARGRGLTTVAVYAGKFVLGLDGLTVREVDPADTFEPAVDESAADVARIFPRADIGAYAAA